MSILHSLQKREFEVTVNTNIADFLTAVYDDEFALDLVKAIDLHVADTDFTELLIRELFRSLRTDVGRNDAKDLISELKLINKSIK